jgi:hypothetical protein
MAIHHYFTRSRADWTFKLVRGKADAPDPITNRYRDETHSVSEQDSAVEDTRVIRFVPRLRSLLRG